MIEKNYNKKFGLNFSKRQQFNYRNVGFETKYIRTISHKIEATLSSLICGEPTTSVSYFIFTLYSLFKVSKNKDINFF